MVAFPARGQRAPQYWDEQLKQYIDERAADVSAHVGAADPHPQYRNDNVVYGGNNLNNFPIGLRYAFIDAANHPVADATTAPSYRTIVETEALSGSVEGILVQTVTAVDGGARWKRTKFNGTWTGWTETRKDATATATMRAQTMASGGGTLSVAGNAVKWTEAFMAIATGIGPHFSLSGFFQISPPPPGTVITGVNGAADVTVDSNGYVNLEPWHALYYALPIGAGYTSVPGNYRVASYGGANTVVPDTWVMIAQHNANNYGFRFINGVTLSAGHTWNAVDGYSQYSKAHLVLNATDPVPPGTPAGTIILRRAGGDTGWRSIPSLLHSNWTAGGGLNPFKIRRINNEVFLAMNISATSALAAGQYQIFTTSGAPAGFNGSNLVEAEEDQLLPNANGVFEGTTFFNRYGTPRLYRAGGFASGQSVRGMARWLATDPWPTSLPGTAA